MISMRGKIIAFILILANVLTLASCSVPQKAENTDPDTESSEEEDRSYSEEKIYENIEKITAAVAACDFEDLSKRCAVSPDELLEFMPVIEDKGVDTDFKTLDNMLIIRNAIASTITCDIDESTFKGGLFDKKYTVDVKFFYKDYTIIPGMRDRFLGGADFATLLDEVEGRLIQVLTLEFVRDDKKYLLANPEVLVSLYKYDLPELEFMESHFDMIENSFLTGPGWDSTTECYYDTNTFEFDIVLDTNAKNYIWQYIYAVSEETEPEWTHIYTSDVIVDKYPSRIELKYTQEENFSSGYYCFIIYDVRTEEYYGWEFYVYNTAEEIPTVPTVSGSVEDSLDETEQTEET